MLSFHRGERSFEIRIRRRHSEPLALESQYLRLPLAGIHQSFGDTLISQDSHMPQPRNYLSQEFELLRGLLWIKARHTCEVSARPLQACYDIVCHRIDHYCEDDRDGCDCFFGHASCEGTRHGDNIDVETNQLCKEVGETLILAFRKSRLDHIIVAFDVSEVRKPLPEC